MKPVSVVLALYNGERFLQQQLESLLPQIDQIQEIVVSDDGSQDASLSLVERFMSDLRGQTEVRILRHDRTGSASDNFRFAMAQTSGRWVAFCDQDDVWEPHKLATMTTSAERFGAAAVGCSYRVIDEVGQPVGTVRWTRRARLVRRLQRPLLEYVLGCYQLVSRDVVNMLVGDWPARACGEPEHHDFATLFASRHLGGFLLLPDVLVHYRRHRGNVSQHHALDRGYDATMRARTGAHSYESASAEAETKARWWVRQPCSVSETAAEDWRRRAKVLRARSELYRAAGLRRPLMLAGSIAGGAYGPTTLGCLGLRSLAADIVFCIRGRS